MVFNSVPSFFNDYHQFFSLVITSEANKMTD